MQALPMDQQNATRERISIDELDEHLKREEIFWQKKAKTRWLEEGDANTHYFHITTIVHRRHNKIKCIQNA